MVAPFAVHLNLAPTAIARRKAPHRFGECSATRCLSDCFPSAKTIMMARMARLAGAGQMWIYSPLELAWLTVHRPPAGRALNLWLGACMRIDPCARAVEPCAVEPCTSFE